MKRILSAVFTLLLLSGGAHAADTPKESAYDHVMRTQTIHCGYAISPPILVQDPNTKIISGLDYDIWKIIGSELDLKVEFVEEVGYGNFIEGLRTNRYDAFCSGIWADPARIKFLSLTEPVTYSFLKAYVRTDNHRFDGNLEKIDSPDVTIPAVDGDVSVKMAQSRFPQAKIHYLPQTATVSEMIMAVQTKKADVVFLDQGMTKDFEAKNPGVLRALTDVPAPYVFSSHFSVLSGEIQLRDMIDVVLRKMIDDGRMERLAKKYSEEYVVPLKNYAAQK
jgi:ABC-type amino acid transport substrate-binding protein